MRVLHISRPRPAPVWILPATSPHWQVCELTLTGYEAGMIAPIPRSPFPPRHCSRPRAFHSHAPSFDVLQVISAFSPRCVGFARGLLTPHAALRRPVFCLRRSGLRREPSRRGGLGTKNSFGEIPCPGLPPTRVSCGVCRIPAVVHRGLWLMSVLPILPRLAWAKRQPLRKVEQE